MGAHPSLKTPMATKTVSFRKMLQRSLLLDSTETQLFDQIPDAVIEGLFRHNFNGSLATAERVLFNRYSDVEDVDRARLEQEKRNIHNLAAASDHIRQSLENGVPVLFVTDNDNDGSLAQAVLMEFVACLPEHQQKLVHVEYAQPIGASRGLTHEVTQLAVEARDWAADQPFTLVTADNGINNRHEVERIQASYPNAFVIITDHHLPNADVVQENGRALVFNPKYQPTPYFQRKNISGANTLGVLLTNVLPPREQLTTEVTRFVDNMAEIGSWANLLDYANADIADMPNRPYVIEKALKLRPLLNVSNSMNTLVTGRMSEADFSAISEVSGGMLSAGWIKARIDDVQLLNTLARKLLTLYHRYLPTGNTLGENDFYAAMSAELEGKDEGYTSVNPNYIEQLRPIIFNLAAAPAKSMFLSKIEETMTELFSTLRDQERTIQEGLRQVGLLRQDLRPHSSILYPIDPSVTRVFNRKLLGKAYNTANNGFLLILSKVDGKEASGSMRSLYPMPQILEGKEAIEKKLGVTLDFQGHDMAAGFFVRAQKGTHIDEALLSKLNVWLDDRIQQLKMAEKINTLPNVELDFASVSLVQKVNNAVKANLAGMWGVPAIIRFSPGKDDQVWVTDPQTTEQINLAEVVKRKRYGYQAIATDFGGGAFVVPIELLRTVVESRFKKGFRLSYMDEGVFMANQVVDPDQMPGLVPVKGGRVDQEDLQAYYQEHFDESHFMPLSREDFRNIPYFKFNRFGQQEFEQWEALIINMLDRSGRDILSVVDTEGTGLGKAPKCFNLGGTNIKVAEGSGQRLDRTTFEKRLYRDAGGREYLLEAKQIEHLMDVNEDEDEQDLAKLVEGPHTVLYSTTLEDGFEAVRVLYPGAAKELTLVRNRKVDEETGEVVYNRTVDGFAFAYLVANADFAITQEFEDLTGVSNAMVKKLGRPAKDVDQDLVAHLSKMTNEHGEPAKFIFQAHNMPYDKGVVSANFQKLNQMMDEHVTSDTAKVARREKLAYDDTPVCSFEGVAGLPPKAYFYDSPFSDYSMSTFLNRIERTGKGGVFPDINAKLLLRYDSSTERFSVIDRDANQEVLLAVSLSELKTAAGDDNVNMVDGEAQPVKGCRVKGHLPNNAVKYSVERMSSRAMIRNILLHEELDIKLVDLTPEESVYQVALELFQKNYHFDNSLDENIQYFQSSLYASQTNRDLFQDVDMEELGHRFLLLNREIQARFHDGWIYEKVLNHYEPSASRVNLTSAEVEQINYFTDLPSKKIREVCRKIVNFKRAHGIDHALVHEQHNNIRMRSPDGQGLADTAYESVLPQLLGMFKFYNPYYRSIEPAARQLIEQNFKGSMVQHMVNDNFKSELARDSYSMKQMMAFRRQGNTDLINRARRVASGRADEALDVVKFKLSADVLPPGTAIYGTPKRHVSQDEVLAVSAMLDEILIQEQVKCAALYGSSLNHEHAVRAVAMAQAHDPESIAKREQILELFDHVEFSKRDGEITKLADLMKEAVDTGCSPKLPKTFTITDDMLEIAKQMVTGLEAIYAKINQGERDTEHLRQFVKELTTKAEDTAKRAAIAAEKAAKNADKEEVRAQEERESFGLNEAGVRAPNFLYSLDITRREPFKFLIKHTSLSGCLPWLRQQRDHAAQVDPVPPTVVVTEVDEAPAASATEAKPKRRRRVK